MGTRAELQRLIQPAQTFANGATEMLNKTVCNGARVRAIVSRDEDQDIVIVGTQLDERDLVATPIPLTIDKRKPQAWLDAMFRCDLDERGYLRVLSSYFAIYAPDGETPLCHYDYERKKEGYPAAHLQIDGHCEAIGKLPGPRASNELAKLHFPVGGRRYRPTLEDMVEFVITEKFARGRRGWREVVDKHRDGFNTKQLRAAVWRRPDEAIDVLKKMGKI